MGVHSGESSSNERAPRKAAQVANTCSFIFGFRRSSSFVSQQYVGNEPLLRPRRSLSASRRNFPLPGFVRGDVAQSSSSVKILKLLHDLLRETQFSLPWSRRRQIED